MTTTNRKPTTLNEIRDEAASEHADRHCVAHNFNGDILPISVLKKTIEPHFKAGFDAARDYFKAEIAEKDTKLKQTVDSANICSITHIQRAEKMDQLRFKLTSRDAMIEKLKE